MEQTRRRTRVRPSRIPSGDCSPLPLQKRIQGWITARDSLVAEGLAFSPSPREPPKKGGGPCRSRPTRRGGHDVNFFTPWDLRRSSSQETALSETFLSGGPGSWCVRVAAVELSLKRCIPHACLTSAEPPPSPLQRPECQECRETSRRSKRSETTSCGGFQELTGLLEIRGGRTNGWVDS